MNKIKINPSIMIPIGEVEEILDKVWKDEELQDAINQYGEWNEQELNKAFEITKRRVLYEYLLKLLG